MPGATAGEAVLSSTAAATLNVSSLTFTKSITNTAVGSDTSPNIYIGEQIQFQLLTVLPGGIVRSFSANPGQLQRDIINLTEM